MADDARARTPSMRFLSGAKVDQTLHLRGLEGRERISSLFEYELLLTCASPLSDTELDDLLHSPCAVQLGEGAEDVVHGLIAELHALDGGRDAEMRYRITLVPTLWLLTLTRTNRIYQGLAVDKLTEAILQRYELRPPGDYRILQLKPGEEREYMVQYDESDWDFVQRWLEDAGLFYWFEHAHDRDVLVISDRNEEATPLSNPASLAYRDRNDLATGGVATVWELDHQRRRVPARVVVQDYNYRRPELTLKVKSDVDSKRGFGTAFHYNDHFQTQEEGEQVASLRAEQLLCERRVYAGQTDSPRLHAGHSFELTDHPIAELNGRYLVTEVDHRAGCAVDAPRDTQLDDNQAYRGSFRAIMADVAYRPPRRTPWPSIEGIMHGHIAADGDGKYAEMDDSGRYKVALPFDTAGTQGTKVSRWIRMAQPYSGVGHGTHHPLRKGTEVLIAHIDGDPDRPIIVGTVPNAQTPSPTTSKNATQSVVKTASGIRIEMEDRQE